jgi:serine phosphatase RsbU (regulator of sigma subunit)/pSer/pThr/pTyr-binding forkhead associated (FHA) protein
MASLIFLAGPNTGRRYKLGEGDYIIGRRSDCQIFVPDMRVSRQHARLRREKQGWCVEDLGSNNGTFVNGQRVQNALLQTDDEITIANNRIRVDMPMQTPKPRSSFDAHVTIVDLDNPEVFLSREDSDSARFLRSSALVGVQEGARDVRLLERKLNALSAILETAANTTDPDELLEAVVSQLLEVFPQADAVGVLVEDTRTGKLEVTCHKHRIEQPYGADLQVPGTIISRVVAHQRGILLGDHGTPRPGLLDQASVLHAGAPLAIPPAAEEALGTRMGAPIQARNTHYGVVYVECSTGSFRQEDLDLLTSIAAQAGLALHAARMHTQLQQRQRLERDLRVARQIQRSLLPAELPRVVGLDFAIHYEPAYQIGGDFYDFVWHDKTHLAVMVGDVAGKAISAALYMARLTSELRSRAAIARTPSRLIRRVNEEMVKLGDDGMFATLIYAVYDLESRTLVFTNAGHVSPLLRRGDRVFPLHAERAHVAPVGVMPDLEVGEARVQLHSGDMIVFTTDGIQEARDAEGREYGLKRLSRRIRSARGGADDVVRAILQDVDAHVKEGTQGDDITVVAMSIDTKRARRRTSTYPGLGEPGEQLRPGDRELPDEPDTDHGL